MSRRFGRQQKRKMRAQLANIQGNVSLLREINKNKTRAIDDIEYRLTELLRMLPENSVFKPLRRMDYIRIDYPYLNVRRDSSRFELSEPGVGCIESAVVQSERIPLVHIFAILEQHHESFRNKLWIRASAPTPEQNKAYVVSLSQEAFTHPTRDTKRYLMDHLYERMEREFWSDKPSRLA